MTNRTAITPLFFLLASGLQPQGKSTLPPQVTSATPPLMGPRAVVSPRMELPANLLPAGKTQGTFHLTGLVRKDRTVVLRWANDQGEMPTEGLHVFRQKVGEATWKDVTGKKPIGFLQGRAAEKRLDAMPPEERDRILAYPFGNVQHDTTSKLRQLEVPRSALTRAKDLSPEKSLKQFRELRAAGKLNRGDLQMMHMRADLDTGLAEVLGLTATDDPGKGQFKYKIVIALPEGGQAEVVCPKTFDTTQPTPIPQPTSLTAASGNGEVLLNWDETPTDAVTGYQVYRSESPSGPWQRITTDPVKRVELELEDPETSLRRAMGIQGSMERSLKPLPEAARTPQKVAEAHRQALDRVSQPGGLPALSPKASAALQASLAAGRVHPGGRQAPRALFTDSIKGGSAIQNEKTYHYKVTAVDLGGQEQSLDTAPVVAGIPKDLEPPQVPGRPMLKAEASARDNLRTVQAARLKDPRVAALDQRAALNAPAASTALTPFQVKPAAPAAPLASTPSLGASASGSLSAPSLSASEAKRQQRALGVATMPVGALKALGEAGILRSNADGSVAPAALVWSPSPDADLQGYEVYRATGDGPLQKMADTAVAEWTDSTLQAGQAYRYAITSVDKRGNVSGRSPEGKLEVSDSSLPGRLAVGTLSGKVTQEAPPSGPSRRLLRPASLAMASGSLRAARSAILAPKAAVSGTFTAPKASVAPKAKLALATKPSGSPSSSASAKSPSIKEAAVLPAATLAPGRAALLAKPVAFRAVRSPNLMLALAQPKEIHVLLEWAKPLPGANLDYVLQQAPQKVELISAPRPSVSLQSGLRAFEVLAPRTTATAASPALHPVALSGAGAAAAKPVPGQVAMNPALHSLALRGVVASQGAGLRLAEGRKEHLAKIAVKGGPGTFTRVNDAPVGTERYIVTFPADVAQYGGATFYFRVQALTKEFGRTVEGPLSEPIEVRLPDIVAPPSPSPGSVDLQETPQGRLDVALSWTQTKAPDLAGTFVERQALSYTLVDGEAKAGAPLGAVERLTPSAIGGTAFTDKQATPGYIRYTLRSVDATGNVSDPQGSLDVFVPGEPVPGAPTQLALAGSALTWKAAPDAAGYTIWRSFTGEDDDYECISSILGATETSFVLPAQGTLHLRVVARSSSGMNTTPSQPLVRTP
ncbi:MAG: hypothetical protein LWW79_08880 [Holophagaceae bacterium]|nr:hypothetical protein [Holophagaceae bacterium]